MFFILIVLMGGNLGFFFLLDEFFEAISFLEDVPIVVFLR